MKKRRVPLFDVHCYFSNCEADARDFIAKNSATPDEDAHLVDQCRGVCFQFMGKEGKIMRCMCVFDGCMGTAVHEAVHMAWMILDYCCVKITKSNDEPLAYLAAWLAMEMASMFPFEKAA